MSGFISSTVFQRTGPRELKLALLLCVVDPTIGGVMVIPVGDLLGDQILLRLTRDKDGFSSQHLMHVRFVPLVEGLVQD